MTLTPEELEAKVALLEAEVLALRQARWRRLVYPVVIVFISMFAAVGVSVLYTYKSNQVWCDLVVGLDIRYQNLHTTDPDAIKFARQIHTVVQKYHCH